MMLEAPLSPLLFGKSFMKIRSAVRLSGIFLTDGKKQKTKETENREKTSVKHIRIRLISSCVNKNIYLAKSCVSRTM